MSNNQWNNGPAEGQWQPQPDWAPAPPQPSAGEWNQDPAAQEWGQAQPQQSANDWGQPQPQQSANDWAQAQPQQSANDWNVGAPQQGWNQDQQHGWNQGQQQGWNQGQQQGWDQGQHQGWNAVPKPPEQQWQQPRQHQPSGLSKVFDFSFKKFALPDAGGTIFLLAVIAILVKWLMDVVQVLTLQYADFAQPGAAGIASAIIGGLAVSLLYILAARVFLEAMSALVTRAQQDRNSEEG